MLTISEDEVKKNESPGPKVFKRGVRKKGTDGTTAQFKKDRTEGSVLAFRASFQNLYELRS